MEQSATSIGQKRGVGALYDIAPDSRRRYIVHGSSSSPPANSAEPREALRGWSIQRVSTPLMFTPALSAARHGERVNDVAPLCGMQFTRSMSIILIRAGTTHSDHILTPFPSTTAYAASLIRLGRVGMLRTLSD